MALHMIKKVPTPDEIRETHPMGAELVKIKTERDAEIRKVFTGESDKFLAIIGPCSADYEDSVLDYLCRLSKVQETVKDKIIIIATHIKEDINQLCDEIYELDNCKLNRIKK